MLDRSGDGTDEVCSDESAARGDERERGIPSTSGSANSTSPGGRTSGTPPTRVDTTKRPADAASRIPIPNASVSEGLRKICARESSCSSQCRQWMADTHSSDVLVPNGTQELDTVVQQRLILVPHLVELDNFGSVAA